MKRTPLKRSTKRLKRTGLKRKPGSSLSKKKSKKVNYRDKADGLWQLLMWHMWNGECAMCGKPLEFDEFTGQREGAGHHLIGKRIYHLRHSPLNGILFCNDCHNFSDAAPHAHPEVFTEWLIDNFPAMGEWVHENIGLEGMEPDYQEVCTKLKVLIREARGGI